MHTNLDVSKVARLFYQHVSKMEHVWTLSSQWMNCINLDGNLVNCLYDIDDKDCFVLSLYHILPLKPLVQGTHTPYF